MPHQGTVLSRFLSDCRGGTAIEYGLIAALIAVALLTVLNQFSNANNRMYNKIRDAMAGSP